MKRLLTIVIAGLLPICSWAQDNIILTNSYGPTGPDFQLNLGTNPPPNTLDLRFGITVDDNSLNFVLGDFTTDASSAFLVKKQPDGSLTPVILLATQISIGSGYSYSPNTRGVYHNSAIVKDDFIAGLWAVQLDFGGGNTFTGWIEAVPEPSSFALGLAGVFVLAHSRRRIFKNSRRHIGLL